MSENENAKTAGVRTGALLVEARTEELPPQLLRGLAVQFPQTLLANLRRSGFADDESFPETDDGERNGNPKLLATPRRIVALLRNIRRAAADRMLVRRGPQVTAALDKDGRPTKALEGFLRATGKAVGDLRKLSERGREYFAVDLRESGGTLEARLAAIVQESLLSLNAPRLMRWGANDWRFIRPLRGLAMLWESDAIAGEVMGVRSSRTTLGHRFMSEGPVGIPSAGEYEKAMGNAKVIVDMAARHEKISNLLSEAANENNGKWGTDTEDGVLAAAAAAICEFPHVCCGRVRPEFMDIPDPCFDLCLRKHQWCFPLKQSAGERLPRERLPRFLFVADNAPENPAEIIAGLERVLSARLADVAFYLAEDRKSSPEGNREKLKRIVYHEKLGSQFDRAERIRAIAGKTGAMMNLSGEDAKKLDRAAAVCKLDLPTLTVGEHPELAGQIAAICFAADDRIRGAVEDHERKGIQGGGVGKALALANHMEKIVGFFGVGEKPTGNKDPFGLRRSAADVAFVLMISKLRCDELIDAARESFDGLPLPHFDRDEIHGYVADRLRQNKSVLETGAGTAELNAILSSPPPCFDNVLAAAEALVRFTQMPEAASLIEANKRINNIFRKSGMNPKKLPEVDDGLFEHEEERRLDSERRKVAKAAAQMAAEWDSTSALRALSSLASPLDAFFDKVMVNADDEKIRANRFALLAELRALLNQVADISKLAG